jgi:hypothetical protein
VGSGAGVDRDGQAVAEKSSSTAALSTLSACHRWRWVVSFMGAFGIALRLLFKQKTDSRWS